MTAAPRALSRDAVLVGGASLARVALATVASLIIARALGPQHRGEWGVIASLAVLIGTLGSLGLPSAAAYLVARSEVPARPRVLGAAMTGAVAFASLAGAVYLCLVLLGAGSGPFSARVIGTAVCAAVVIHAVAQQALLTSAPLVWFATVELLPAAAMLVVIAAAWATGEVGVVFVASASALTTAAGAVLAVTGLLRHGPLVRPPVRLRESLSILRPVLGYGLAAFATTSLTLVVQRVDILLVNSYRGAASAGLYVVAVQFGDVLLVLPVALGNLLYRRGATEAAGHWRDALRTIRWMAAVATLTSVAFGLAAPKVVTTLVGESYRESAGALRWLLPGVVLLALQSLVSNYVASRGRPRAVLLAWLVAAAVGLLLDLFLIPAYGINGAAIASSISYMVVLGLHVRPMLTVRPGAER